LLSVLPGVAQFSMFAISVLINFYSVTACDAMHSLVKPFLPIRPPVKRVWQNERNLCQLSYTTWKIIHPISLARRMVGGVRGATPAYTVWTWTWGLCIA